MENDLSLDSRQSKFDVVRNRSVTTSLIYVLFFILPFVQSINDTDLVSLIKARVLPSEVSLFASILRWVILCYIFLYSFLRLNKSVLSNRWFWFLPLFYLFQFFYALFTYTDVTRYLTLVVESISIPLFCVHILKRRELNKFVLIWMILILVSFSVLFNIDTFLSGFRFLGFVNNPNLYGSVALFWLTILLMNRNNDRLKRLTSVLILITAITIILTASRNALIGLVIVLLFTYGSDFKKVLLLFFIFLLLSFIFSAVFLEFPELARLGNIGGAVSDSGRSKIWEVAWDLIKKSPYWGYGMNASVELVNTGNLHNCYLFYLLTMGTIYTGIALSFLGLFLTKLFIYRVRVPAVLVGFIFAFVVMNFGEDYFVGPGSSVFVYFLISVGLVMHFLEKGTTTSNRLKNLVS